ncbi:MAG TPA: hypothetical protein PL125_03110 [Candidatus Omnitrophota bacterium]|nr:hypothetical protein [Candidatus Omnitrophota bacterium]HPT39169.1 hypothetical protein [Candidatus Omnitrophota bacterium]
MMLIVPILLVLGLGIAVYAVVEVFASGKSAPAKKKNHNQPSSTEDLGKEQKIQRLQSQVVKLESQLEEAKVGPGAEKTALPAAKEKEAQFSEELKRREEWVAKAEAELAKVKAENVDINNKFIAKESELQEEFAKNVNLTREIREAKSALEAKEMACKLKEDQLQAQKHQIESQLKSINENLAAIAEFKRKEKISEWVPKLEFNQLNAEYTKLEKELEETQERLKSFAVEITHLRQLNDKKPPSAEEVKSPEIISEETPSPDPAPEDNLPAANILPPPVQDLIPDSQNQQPQTATPAEDQPEEVKAEDDQLAEKSRAIEKIKLLEENIENKLRETEQEDQKEGEK